MLPEFVVIVEKDMDVQYTYSEDENQHLPEYEEITRYYLVQTSTGKRHHLTKLPNFEEMQRLDEGWAVMEQNYEATNAMYAKEFGPDAFTEMNDLPF